MNNDQLASGNGLGIGMGSKSKSKSRSRPHTAGSTTGNNGTGPGGGGGGGGGQIKSLPGARFTSILHGHGKEIEMDDSRKGSVATTDSTFKEKGSEVSDNRF